MAFSALSATPASHRLNGSAQTLSLAQSPCLRIGAPLSGEPHPRLQWIEVASFLQIPGFQIIGLAAPEVAEARERVRAAIDASDLDFPRRRIVLNLSPASIRKRGTGADLAMALAVLHESYGDEFAQPLSVVAWGELGLDGRLKAAGQISCAVYAAWEAGADVLLVADEEWGLAQERLATLRLSELIPGKSPPRILPARDLREAWKIIKQLPCILSLPAPHWVPAAETRLPAPTPTLLPLSRSLERLLGVAASGNHHLILLGPRGTGKSHALEWLIALQPEPSAAVRIRRLLLEELGGTLTSFQGQIPVRRVSAHVRPSALIGRAAPWGIRPGEFSLAHGGLLLADEFPEWSRDSRESLREPLERGCVTLTRARQAVELPARFTLAANGNLCPCGGWPPEMPVPAESEGKKIARCQCSARVRTQYLSRLSGPVLDRLDLIAVAAHPGEHPGRVGPSAAERLLILREQVAQARARAVAAWGTVPGLFSSADLELLLQAHPVWQETLHPSKFLSLRTRHKVLRVALSLAAWDGLPAPTSASFSEATFYRPERYGLTG